MNKLINDFVNADLKCRPSSFFDGDDKAAEISGKMSKNQRRKFQRYQTVPAAFYVYLRNSQIINKDARIPKGGTTLGDLLDFLRWYPYKTEQAKSGGEYLFREIIKAECPYEYISRNKIFGLSDHILHESKITIKRRRQS